MSSVWGCSAGTDGGTTLGAAASWDGSDGLGEGRSGAVGRGVFGVVILPVDS